MQVRQNKLEMAKESFEEACRLFEAGGGGNVHYSAACAGLGQVFYLKGQISEAVHWYEKALTLMERDFGRTEYYSALADCVMKLKNRYETMKGMELSKAYFEEYGKPLIDTRLLQYRPYIAAGLVAGGSERRGLMMIFPLITIFGPAFCIWVPEWLYQQAGAESKSAYDSLPAEYHGYRRIPSGTGRRQSRRDLCRGILP